jgi:hypothetical protein
VAGRSLEVAAQVRYFSVNVISTATRAANRLASLSPGVKRH